MTIKTFQAGRALAALAVVAFHLSIMMGLPRYGGQAVYREYTQWGNRGVDFFFVLSGFIILFAHAGDVGRPARWGHYVRRRFVRLFPIYWLYTGVYVLALSVMGGTDAGMPGTWADWLTSLSLLRFTDANPPLGVAWTLFHELAFYAAFSVLIISRRAGALAMGLFMGLALVFFHFPGETGRNAFSTYTAAYNLYFVFGMGAYGLYRRGGSGWPELLTGLGLSGWALFGMPGQFQVASMLLAFGLALLLAGAVKLESAGRLPIPAALAFIGDASYSIYVTHVSLEGAWLKVALKWHWPDHVGAGGSFMAVLVGTVALGCLAYVAVERPLLRALRGKPSGLRAKSPRQGWGVPKTRSP